MAKRANARGRWRSNGVTAAHTFTSMASYVRWRSLRWHLQCNSTRFVFQIRHNFTSASALKLADAVARSEQALAAIAAQEHLPHVWTRQSNLYHDLYTDPQTYRYRRTCRYSIVSYVPDWLVSKLIYLTAPLVMQPVMSLLPFSVLVHCLGRSTFASV